MDRRSLELGPAHIVAIVRASGSLQAIPTILSMLPPDFPAPILVVVAMPEVNVSIVASRFAEKRRLPVATAHNGQIPEAGNVYVAGTERLFHIEQGRLRFARNDSGLDNTMDLLFRSVAREDGPGAIAVILTGMGSDGAAGMKEVRDAGGYTIAQDEASSLIPAKARVAIQLGAVCESLPLERIARRLVELVAPSST
jgi:two-component system chemotaxis response regulator CheB